MSLPQTAMQTAQAIADHYGLTLAVYASAADQTIWFDRKPPDDDYIAIFYCHTFLMMIGDQITVRKVVPKALDALQIMARLNLQTARDQTIAHRLLTTVHRTVMKHKQELIVDVDDPDCFDKIDQFIASV